MSKRNGKSSLASAISLYLLLADGEPSAEIYLNACDRDQASIVFDEAAKMVEQPSASEASGDNRLAEDDHGRTRPADG